jgi:hypothetical protein
LFVVCFFGTAIADETVVIQKDKELGGFSIISDQKFVETFIKEFPKGIDIGSVEHKLYCAKKHGASVTAYYPGKCEPEKTK